MHCKACNCVLGEKEQQLDKRTGKLGDMCYICILEGCGKDITRALFGEPNEEYFGLITTDDTASVDTPWFSMDDEDASDGESVACYSEGELDYGA